MIDKKLVVSIFILIILIIFIALVLIFTPSESPTTGAVALNYTIP